MPADICDAILDALTHRRPIDAPVALVAAHPDDETIGVGPLLLWFRDLRLVHVTDGAPRDLKDASAAGCTNVDQYAALRRHELAAALDTAGAIPSFPAVAGLPLPDQSAALQLSALCELLRVALQGVAVVLTHAFEGGHPDHDAAAFAVQAAGLPTIEFAGYHAGAGGGLEIGCFLPGPDETVIALTPEEQTRRNAMLRCFASQAATLAPFFGATSLRFRPAPRYDFVRPPWRQAYYDDFAWGIDSTRWWRLAAEAAAC